MRSRRETQERMQEKRPRVFVSGERVQPRKLHRKHFKGLKPSRGIKTLRMTFIETIMSQLIGTQAHLETFVLKL